MITTLGVDYLAGELEERRRVQKDPEVIAERERRHDALFDTIRVRTEQVRLDIMRLELDGMNAAEIKLAMAGMERLAPRKNELPLTVITVDVDGEDLLVQVYE